MSSQDGTNGWNEHAKLVLAELKRLDTTIEKMSDRMDKVALKSSVDSLEDRVNDLRIEVTREMGDMKMQFSNDITSLKIKAGLWGMAGAALPTIAVVAILLLTQG